VLLSSTEDSPVTSMAYNNFGTLFAINNANKAIVAPDNDGILLRIEFKPTH